LAATTVLNCDLSQAQGVGLEKIYIAKAHLFEGILNISLSNIGEHHVSIRESKGWLGYILTTV